MLDPTSQLFDRYLDQPQTIPRDVRGRLEHACAGESVQLYGLGDLDSSLRLCQIWVALTANYFGIVRTADLMPVEGLIEFRDVTFGYDRVRLTIKGISFRIEPGELIGVVRPSGSGKTTLINLLVRFYDPTAGEIQIDECR
jgi:ABC-type multidrug transport system fused ATPase/permease subunit